MYNDTNLTSANNPLELATAINDLSGGLFAIVLLVAIFFLLIMVFKRYEEDTRRLLVFSSLIVSILAGLAWGIGLVTLTIAVWPTILFLVFLISMFFE